MSGQLVKVAARGRMPDPLVLLASALQVNPADLSDDDGMQTLPEWDSLKVFQIASMIEIDCGVTLEGSDVERLTTVRDVREVIARYAKGGTS
jgi:acyl carrier protein